MNLPTSPDKPNMPTPAQHDAALLILRIASALAFFYHGSAILFGAFGGPGPRGFSSFMHAPAIIGYLVGLAQFGGGLAMLSGALIRLGAACIIIVMLGAVLLVHLPHGFDIGKGGMEYALTQLLIAVALLITGAGRYSVAPWLPSWLRRL
jgi:putative oxidoreductase